MNKIEILKSLLTEQSRPSVNDFIEKNGVTMDVKKIKDRPDGLMDELPYHFEVTLHHEGKDAKLYYSMGKAHAGKTPSVSQALSSFASETTTYLDKESFSTFCKELGYDSEDPYSKKVYSEVLANGKKLEKLFGHELLQELVFKTELD